MPGHKPDKRTEILDAVDELFRPGVGNDVTVDDVARAANVGKGTIYLHFRDKNHLFYEAEVHRMTRLVAELSGKVRPEDSFFRRLLTAAETIDRFLRSRVPVIRPGAFLRGSSIEEARERREEWRLSRRIMRDYVVNLLREGIAEGVLRSDLDVELAALNLQGIMMTRRLEFAGQHDQAPPLEAVLELFVYGLAEANERSALREAMQGESSYT